MIYYCDTEFTKFNGELMSIALVPQRYEHKCFYAEVKTSADIDPWVLKNVVPHMNGEAEDVISVSSKLQAYLVDDPAPVIVADWPEDLSYFLKLLITGPGMMISLDNVTTKLQRTRNWNSADHSTIPHHALYDALALRDFWQK